MEQLSEYADIVNQYKDSIIMGGDLNMGPDLHYWNEAFAYLFINLKTIHMLLLVAAYDSISRQVILV